MELLLSDPDLRLEIKIPALSLILAQSLHMPLVHHFIPSFHIVFIYSLLLINTMAQLAPMVVPALKKHTATVIWAHGLGDQCVYSSQVQRDDC